VRRSFVIILFTAVLISAYGQVLIPGDAESHVEFKIRNFGILVEGSFTGIVGRIRFNPLELHASQFEVSVNSNTIRTGIGARDNHLRKPEYLDVKNFPRIHFLSSKVSSTSKHGEYIIKGTLTIKNKSKEITFLFNNTGNRFKGKFEINRRHFDVGGRSVTMADMVEVHLDIFATVSPDTF
jgi:polyisoprenoid-binding protein YceI